MSRTILANKQCFFLKTNQRTVLSAMVFQQSEHDQYPYKKQTGQEDQRNLRDPNFAISHEFWRQKKLIQTATGRQGKCEM